MSYQPTKSNTGWEVGEGGRVTTNFLPLALVYYRIQGQSEISTNEIDLELFSGNHLAFYV